MASSNSSVSEQDGRYGNSSKQLWKEWGSDYSDVTVQTTPMISRKDALTRDEVKQ